MKTLIIGEKYKEKLGNCLNLQGFDVFWLPKNTEIDEKLAFHADISVFVYEKTAILANFLKNNILVNLLTNRGYEVIISQIRQSKKYPGDINLCAAKCAGRIIHNPKYTDPCIRNLGISMLNVNQGYSRCSCLTGNDFIITSDKGVASAAKKINIDTLIIDDSDILLEGFDRGFIGGASFVCGNTIYFTGDINKLADGDMVKRYLSEHNYKYICLTNEPLFDIGGAIVV